MPATKSWDLYMELFVMTKWSTSPNISSENFQLILSKRPCSSIARSTMLWEIQKS